MKKFIAILMTAALMLSTAACGGGDKGGTTGGGGSGTSGSGTSGGGDGDTSGNGNGNSSGTPTEPEAVTLKVWAPQNQIDNNTIGKMQDAFQAAHPEWVITFETGVMGEDNAKAEVLKDVGAAADVFFFANDQIEELFNAGAIARLGGEAENLVRTTMASAVADTVTINGGIYGIPFTHNTFFMYYDKSLLSEDDVKSLDSIMAKDLGDGVYNFQFDAAGGWKGAAYYYGAGLTIYGEDQVSYAEGCNWNNETGIAVTNYLIDLINNPKCAWASMPTSELAMNHKLGA